MTVDQGGRHTYPALSTSELKAEIEVCRRGFLVVAQRGYRVYPSGFACRQVAGRERDAGEQKGYAHKNSGVGGADPEENS